MTGTIFHFISGPLNANATRKKMAGISIPLAKLLTRAPIFHFEDGFEDGFDNSAMFCDMLAITKVLKNKIKIKVASEMASGFIEYLTMSVSAMYSNIFKLNIDQ